MRLQKIMAAIGAALALAGGANGGQEEGVPVPVASAQGFRHQNGRWDGVRSIHLPEGRLVLVEAEQAENMLTDALQADTYSAAGAHGGLCLFDPPALTFAFEIREAGHHEIRLRLTRDPKTFIAARTDSDTPSLRSVAPAIDGTTLTERLLDAALEEWRWTTVATANLTVGIHRVTIPALKGYRFDRLAVRPAAEPAEASGEDSDDLAEADAENGGSDEDRRLDGAATTATRVLPACTLVTAPLRPLSVARWTRLESTADLAGGQSAFSVTQDGGKTWQPLPADGSLAGLTPPADAQPGTGTLAFKLEWTAHDPQATPHVDALRVRYEKGPLAPFVITGPDMALHLHPATGQLMEIRDAATGAPCIVPGAREWFGITWRSTGEAAPRVFRASDCRFEGMATEPDGTWNARYSNAESGLSVTCRIQPAKTAGDTWTWTLAVTNAGTGTVQAADFPRVGGWDFPEQALRPESLWGRSGDTNLFPGDLSMGWVFLSGHGRGLYLASRDQSLIGVSLTAGIRPGDGAIGARHYGIVAPGGSRDYAYALALGNTDWHWAADHYRTWASSWMKRPNAPEWARRSDGWYSIDSDTEAALLDRRSVTIFDNARWLGLTHLQLWVGCGDGMFVGRMPYLSPRLGTPEAARRDSERIRQWGGHIGHYIQAREWSAAYGTTDMVGYVPRAAFPADVLIEDAQWSARNTLQSAGIFGSPQPYEIMCPSSAEWQTHIVRHARERVSLFGNDAAYFDQMGCTAMGCAAGHAPHGAEQQCSGRGYTEMAAQALAAMRTENPACAIANEGMSAATGQSVYFHLASSRPYMEHGKEFLYTFPDLAVVRGYSNGVFSYQGMPLRAFLRGQSLFHRFEMPAFDPYARDLLLLRKRFHDWQYDGRFMDDAGLAVDEGRPVEALEARRRIRAKWFLHGDGILITYCNEDAVPSARLTLDCARIPLKLAAHAVAMTDDGSAISCAATVTETAVSLALPARTVGSIAIPSETISPEARMRLFAWQATDTLTPRVHVQAMNLSAQAVKAEWRLTLPEGITASHTTGTLDVPAFSAVSEAIDITTALHIDNATLAWTSGTAQKTCELVIAPALRNGGMELDRNGDGSPDSWWNLDKTMPHILHRLVQDADLPSLPATLDATRAHGGRVSAQLHPVRKFVTSITSYYGSKGKDVEYPCSIGQYLYLPPATRCTLTVYCLSDAANARVTLAAGGQRVECTSFTPGEWKPLSVTFETTAANDACTAVITNPSPEATVWVDDISLVRAP